MLIKYLPYTRPTPWNRQILFSITFVDFRFQVPSIAELGTSYMELKLKAFCVDYIESPPPNQNSDLFM